MDTRKEFNDLLNAALTDGIITAQERAVLINKAISIGIDPEEANLLIDASEQKVNQDIDAAARLKRGKTCPFCGGSIPQLADQCPHCGGAITAEASQELLEIIDQLEDALLDLKAGKDHKTAKAQVEKYIRRANMYYENNPKVQKLLSEIAKETAEAEKKAKTSARNENILSVLKNIVAFFKSHKILAYLLIGVVVLSLVALCSENEEKAHQTLIENIDSYIEAGKIKEAAKLLEKTVTVSNYDQWDLCEKYDNLYLKVLREMVEDGDFREAEALALTLKSKVTNGFKWMETSTYTYLKTSFEANNQDFSMIRSEYDY